MYANFANDGINVNTDKDSIVLPVVFSTIRGGRALDVTGYTPKVIQRGHLIIKETATGNYKPMPATETQYDAVATVGTVVPGSGYSAAGTYTNVPLAGGSGRGALATVVIAGGVVSTVSITFGGNGYKVGDSLSINAAYVGGAGTGGSVPVATISATVAGSYGALPTGHTYAGVANNSALANKAHVGITAHCQMNNLAAPYPMASILSAVKTALPDIEFLAD